MNFSISITTKFKPNQNTRARSKKRHRNQLPFAAATCFAPTAKNSVITSSGIPFVSGTFKNTNTHAITHTIAYNPKTPERPMEVRRTGSEYVTMMSHIQNVRAQMAMQSPRTLVGNISAHKMLGIGPKPITKVQKYTTTLAVEMAAFTTLPKSITLPTTKITRVKINTGIVVNKRVLQIAIT